MNAAKSWCSILPLSQNCKGLLSVRGLVSSQAQLLDTNGRTRNYTPKSISVAGEKKVTDSQ